MVGELGKVALIITRTTKLRLTLTIYIHSCAISTGHQFPISCKRASTQVKTNWLINMHVLRSHCSAVYGTSINHPCKSTDSNVLHPGVSRRCHVTSIVPTHQSAHRNRRSHAEHSALLRPAPARPTPLSRPFITSAATTLPPLQLHRSPSAATTLQSPPLQLRSAQEARICMWLSVGCFAPPWTHRTDDGNYFKWAGRPGCDPHHRGRERPGH